MKVVETVKEVIGVAKLMYPSIQLYGLEESLNGYFTKEISTVGSSTYEEIANNPFEFNPFFWVADEVGEIILYLRTISIKESKDQECENYLLFYAIK